MKKKLFTLLVCAFACISVNAQSRYSIVQGTDGVVTITKYASDGTTVAKTAATAVNLDQSPRRAWKRLYSECYLSEACRLFQ